MADVDTPPDVDSLLLDALHAAIRGKPPSEATLDWILTGIAAHVLTGVPLGELLQLESTGHPGPNPRTRLLLHARDALLRDLWDGLATTEPRPYKRTQHLLGILTTRRRQPHPTSLLDIAAADDTLHQARQLCALTTWPSLQHLHKIVSSAPTTDEIFINPESSNDDETTTEGLTDVAAETI